MKNLGALQLGALERQGILGKDSNRDGVSGIVLLLRGMNPTDVLEGVHAQVNALNNGILPADVKVAPYLDRTDLVHTTVTRVGHTLLEGMGLVLIILILFLGSARGALMVAATVPFALLFAFICMRFTNIPANLLSLGAIDFGIIVDASIVVMENILRHREENPDWVMSEDDAIASAIQVARPIFFATLIIITAYLPLFAFQRVEKKLFSPMAYVVGYSLIGALLMALGIIPGLALVTYQKPSKPFHNRVLAFIARHYDRTIRHLTYHPMHAIIPAVIAGILAVILSVTIGKEFLPYLDEGSLWLQVQLPPGLSLEKAASMADELRAATLEFPEVSTIVSQLGRNDDGTDPWTPSHIECFVGLKPYDTWPNHGDKQDLIRRMSERFAKIPGATVGFSQPMIDGVNDKISGAHSDLVVKVFGHEFGELRRIASELVDLLEKIPGASDVTIDQEPPLPQIQVRVNREAAARFGINIADIATIIESGIGGKADLHIVYRRPGLRHCRSLPGVGPFQFRRDWQPYRHLAQRRSHSSFASGRNNHCNRREQHHARDESQTSHRPAQSCEGGTCPAFSPKPEKKSRTTSNLTKANIRSNGADNSKTSNAPSSVWHLLCPAYSR